MLTIDSFATLSSGHTIPLLGFGVYQNEGPTCESSVLEALRAGYRHIDSAQLYGNEQYVGAALKKSGLRREDVFLTTKIEHKDYGYQSTLAAVDKSLQRLGVGYIDLFLLHEPYSGKTNRIETYRALLDVKKAGKIRSVGVSNFSPKHIQELLDANLDKPSVNQIEIHPFCQMKQIVPYCIEQGILIEAYAPLARAGRSDHPVLKALSHKHGKTTTQILVRWSLQKGYIPLPKSSQKDRIRANADVYDFHLDEEDMNALDGLDEGKEGGVTWWPYDAE